jgi:beta-galactosidase
MEAAGVSWGGLHILAGPNLADAEVGNRQGHASLNPDDTHEFVYGAAFFRPPNPPRSERREMLREVAQKYRFNIIRIYLAWVYCNPERDRFDFTELEEVMGYCDEFGLRVLMGVITEEAPYWLEQEHPETRFVDAKGRRHRLSDSGNNVSGGWPGLCLDWEPVQQAAARFIREMVRVVSPHRSMYAYDCWNEPHIEPAWARNIWATPQDVLFCYCGKTIEGFQDWLKKKYGTLDRLNDAWVRRYPDWTTIDPPRHMGTYLDWIDWRRFIFDRSAREMRFRVETVRAADPDHLLESHAATHAPIDPMAVSGINGWRLAEEVETWGLSLFPRWGNLEIFEGAAKVEITRSYAAGKPFWMTELQGGHGNSGLRRSPKMRPRDIRLWNWMAVAGGAKGLVYWAYLTEATGTESSGFGLVARDGSQTERVVEAAKDNQLIQANWEIFRNYRPTAEVAILFDQDNALLSYAMSGNEDASTESFRGYYKALWNADVWVDFIQPGALASTSYRVLIVPWHLIGKRNTCEQLRRFVEGGGTLVLETAFGMYDERCFYNPVIPPFGLAEAFGYREEESYFLSQPPEPNLLRLPAAERIYYEPEIAFDAPVAARLKGHTFLTPITIKDSTPIARSNGSTVGATKKLGNGQVYYIGTNLGASITSGSHGGIDLIKAIVTSVVKPAVTAEGVRPRLVRSSHGCLLVVFNDTPEDQITTVHLPAGYRHATDLYSMQQRPVEGSAIRLAVSYQDVAVMRLE